MTNLSQSIRDHLTPETILASLGSPQQAERLVASEYLKNHLDNEAYRQILVAGLCQDAAPSAHVLDALSSIAGIGDLPLFDGLLTLLESDESAVRRSSARVMARCFSRRCHELSPWFDDSEIRFECCFSGDATVAHALLQWYVDRGRTPDIALGLLLKPDLVYDLSSRFPQATEAFAQQFGYIEGANLAEALPLLEGGIWCVPVGITKREQRLLEQRTEHIVSTLLAILDGHNSHDDVMFDPHSLLDIAALCGGVRCLDHDSLLQHRFENRLHSRTRDNVRRALCKHAPFDFCRKILLADPLQAAERLGIPATMQGNYVIEHAAALVTHDSNLRVERMTYLKSRWAPRAGQRFVIPSVWKFPVEQDADAPELKFRVLTPQQLTATRTYLDAPSPGALAAARLLQTVGRSDLISPLFAAEEQSVGKLCACGIEVQIPFSVRRENDSLAWKQALRALGVPSPRRPEYRTMVEVAFPPSRSYQPQVLLPLALEQLGLFTEPVDMALHLSFSGDLGPEVRFLLLAQQLINEPMVQPRGTRLARLMSKGFAHLNHDALPLDGVNHAGLRTELRSYRFGYKEPAHDAPLERQFIDDIIETSLLIAAKQCPSDSVNQVWTHFSTRIADAVQQLPELFSTLLNADWYAATEEPSDEDFARRLPISQAWIAVRSWIAAEGQAVELRQMFRGIRRACAADADDAGSRAGGGEGAGVRRGGPSEQAGTHQLVRRPKID